MSHRNRHRTSRNTKPDNPLEFPDTGKTNTKQSKLNVTIDFDSINTPVKHP